MRSYSPAARGDSKQGQCGEGQKDATLIHFAPPVMQERLDKKQKRDAFTGRVKWIWSCPTGLNHLRDCALQAVRVETMVGVLPDQESGIVRRAYLNLTTLLTRFYVD